MNRAAYVAGIQETSRRVRARSAREAGVSIAKATAYGLSPSKSNLLKAIAEHVPDAPFSIGELRTAWRSNNGFDIKGWIVELQGDELVEQQGKRWQLTAFGREVAALIER